MVVVESKRIRISLTLKPLGCCRKQEHPVRVSLTRKPLGCCRKQEYPVVLMLVEGIFMESSLMPSPDISLQICLPTPSNESTHAPTDLSLSTLSTATETRVPWGWQQNPVAQPHHLNSQGSFSRRPISDNTLPINGIPNYNNTNLPFIPVCAKTGYYGHQIPRYNTCSSSGSTQSVGWGSPMGYVRMVSPTTYNGSIQHHQQNPYGIGSAIEASLNMMFWFGLTSKLPARRSTRAPRMRWTGTLHAVELLGGHESDFSPRRF